ncbi:MAG: nucleotidyltransferase domain-containing protein [Rectinemataceae bacterium]|nr:nucleotidyltransferase domain-containing protein [Rectinemataceae bacterium]
MRISEHEKRVLVSAVHSLDPRAGVWLFGSRTDDTRKGGDIDIAVLSRSIERIGRMRIKRCISDAIGDQKIDIVVSTDGLDPFFRLALERGVRLDE